MPAKREPGETGVPRTTGRRWYIWRAVALLCLAMEVPVMPDNVVLSKTRPLRVLTLNLWSFTEPYRERQRVIRGDLLKLDPDLMAFQEAGYDGKRHQVADLLEGLGYTIAHEFDGLEKLPGDNGICLASRWPMQVVEVSRLGSKAAPRTYPCRAVAVHVSVPEPVGELLFVGPKPSWELNNEHARELEAVELAKLVQRHRTPFPTIIAGDFDAAPDSASIRFLTGRQSLSGMGVFFLDAWEQAGDGSRGPTWTFENESTRPLINAIIRHPSHSRRIDYIFVGSWFDHPDRYASVRSCRVVMNRPVDGVWPSDHYGVFAEIGVEP